MKAWENYFTIMQEVVANVMESQKENIMKAAKILADTTEKGGIIYGFGTGHSHLAVSYTHLDVYKRQVQSDTGILVFTTW